MIDYQEEQWRVIEGYENYMVSNMGEVWSINNETILSPGNNGTGYLFVYQFIISKYLLDGINLAILNIY